MIEESDNNDRTENQAEVLANEEWFTPVGELPDDTEQLKNHIRQMYSELAKIKQNLLEASHKCDDIQVLTSDSEENYEQVGGELKKMTQNRQNFAEEHNLDHGGGNVDGEDIDLKEAKRAKEAADRIEDKTENKYDFDFIDIGLEEKNEFLDFAESFHSENGRYPCEDEVRDKLDLSMMEFSDLRQQLFTEDKLQTEIWKKSDGSEEETYKPI
jgi:hypothetical protein